MVARPLAWGDWRVDMTEYRRELPPLPNPHQRTVATRPLFSASECDALLDLAQQGTGWSDASVSRPGATDGIVDRDVRSAGLFPLPTDGGWPFHRLVEAIADHNSATFRFDLEGIYESDRPAIARYTAAEFGQFRAHIDAGASHSTRKLSYVVQLDKGSSYTGGDLFFSDLGTAAPRDQGTLVVFPSTLTHVVTPVIEGIRHVVVGWVHGPATT